MRPTPNSYEAKLKQSDQAPYSHTIFAAVCSWLLLAGFVFFPGTFSSAQHSDELKSLADNNKVASVAYYFVRHPPLLGLAATCIVLSLLGLSWLWFKYKTN